MEATLLPDRSGNSWLDAVAGRRGNVEDLEDPVPAKLDEDDREVSSPPNILSPLRRSGVDVPLFLEEGCGGCGVSFTTDGGTPVSDTDGLGIMTLPSGAGGVGGPPSCPIAWLWKVLQLKCALEGLLMRLLCLLWEGLAMCHLWLMR